MFGKNVIKLVMAGLLMLLSLTISACTMAQPQAMTGEEPHPRHDTGLDSQVSDY
jgi:starvation-inducible outer membrane lipoprotein